MKRNVKLNTAAKKPQHKKKQPLVDRAHPSHLERTEFISKVSNLLFSSLNYSVTLGKIAELALLYIADWCAVYLISSEGEVHFHRIAYRNASNQSVARVVKRHARINMDASSGIARVFQTGKSEFYPQLNEKILRTIAHNEEHFSALKRMGIVSRMVVPIRHRNRMIGTITLVSTNPKHPYAKSDLTIAEDLGRLSGVAIDNAHLYEEAQQEIARSKEYEKKLRESNQKLSRMLESTSDAFVSFDKNWRYTYINRNAEKIEGIRREDVLGKCITDVFPEIVEAEHFKRYQEAMRTGMPVEFEVLIAKRWWDVGVYPFEDGVSIFYRDITDRKQFEQRKDEFISMASHELKTPITSLKLYTEMLASDPSIVGEAKNYVESMMTQTDRLSKLVVDLLDVSRMQVGKLVFNKTPVDLGTIVKENVAIIQKTTNQHKIHLTLSRANTTVLGDRDRLGQVIINLLTNAIKYSPDGDKIVVRVGTKKNEAVVSVQDFGVGIDPDYRKKIFNRFYQVASEKRHTFPGLGIGLYISKIIAEHHNGAIDVESMPGTGSTFSFTIPLHRPKKK